MVENARRVLGNGNCVYTQFALMYASMPLDGARGGGYNGWRMANPAPSRSFAAGVLAIAVLCAGAEAVRRWTPEPDPGFYRFLFGVRFNAERWSFLESNRDRLRIGLVSHGPKGLDAVMEPERDRPPFDRIVAPYRVVTNPDGYRERPFVWPAKRPVWFALGDSITFGRGVERADRFTDRLQSALPAGTSVLNFGVPGCTSTCLAEILDRYAARRPDLVILQATANDYDITLWRQASGGRLGRLRALALKAASRSQALLWAAYKVSGDVPERRMRNTVAAAAAFYRPDLERMARALKARAIPMVVVEVPTSMGDAVTGHFADFFRGRPDVCRGVLRVSFDRPQDYIADWDLRLSGLRDRPDWVTQTGQELGVGEHRLSPHFPHRLFFQDIVHPNALGNELIAAQLRRFLAKPPRPGKAP